MRSFSLSSSVLFPFCSLFPFGAVLEPLVRQGLPSDVIISLDTATMTSYVSANGSPVIPLVNSPTEEESKSLAFAPWKFEAQPMCPEAPDEEHAAEMCGRSDYGGAKITPSKKAIYGPDRLSLLKLYPYLVHCLRQTAAGESQVLPTPDALAFKQSATKSRGWSAFRNTNFVIARIVAVLADAWQKFNDDSLRDTPVWLAAKQTIRGEKRKGIILFCFVLFLFLCLI